MIANLKPYPEYKDSGVPWLGVIPRHWDVMPNRALFTEVNERNHPHEEMLSVTITRGVIRQRALLANSSKKDSSNQDKTAYKLVQPRDIAYNKMRAWQGAIGVSDLRGIISPAYVVMRLRGSNNPRYFHHLFRTPRFVKEAERWSYGITSDMWSLRPEHFKVIYATLPSLPEQSAIVRFLDYFDHHINRLIRTKQKLIKLLADQREAITHDALQLASSRRLRIGSGADRVERPINRQDDQVYTPIGLYNRGRGIFHKAPTKGSELGDSTFFWLGEGDLVLSGQFAWEGAVALAGREDDGCVASHRYPVLRGKPDMVESAYLLSFFKTGWGQLLLDHHSRGAAGRNRPLNAASLMKEKVPIPPLPVQKQITALVHLESRLQQAVAELVTLLREYRTRLIADVVTGKLDVRDVIEAGNDLRSYPDLPEKGEELDDLDPGEDVEGEEVVDNAEEA